MSLTAADVSARTTAELLTTLDRDLTVEAYLRREIEKQVDRVRREGARLLEAVKEESARVKRKIEAL